MPIATYYDSPEKLSALRHAAGQLVGTPFFANSEAPGRDGGIDCVHALNWIHRTCGAIGPVEIPRQRMDHGQHSEQSLLIAAFETWPELRTRFALVPDAAPADLLPGDCLCFRAGKVPHHGGVLVAGQDMLHVLKGDGAHLMHLGAVIRGRAILGYLAAVYRPLPL